jgi:hypothetical protein
MNWNDCLSRSINSFHWLMNFRGVFMSVIGWYIMERLENAVIDFCLEFRVE